MRPSVTKILGLILAAVGGAELGVRGYRGLLYQSEHHYEYYRVYGDEWWKMLVVPVLFLLTALIAGSLVFVAMITRRFDPGFGFFAMVLGLVTSVYSALAGALPYIGGSMLVTLGGFLVLATAMVRTINLQDRHAQVSRSQDQ